MKPQIGKVLEKNRPWVLIIAVFGICVDIFLFDFTSDLIILSLILLWVLAVWLYGFEGRISVGICLGFLAICPFLLIFDAQAVAEKFAVWAYMFLVVGVVQQIIGLRREARCR
jgi:hypothetical protein